MGKRSKAKAKKASLGKNELPEEKTNDALKPIPKIKKSLGLKESGVKVNANKAHDKKKNKNNSNGKNVDGMNGKDMKKERENDKHTDKQKDTTTDNPKAGETKNVARGQSYKNAGDKLGGLIFMCNTKTKPDCFKYMVMGLPDSRKDLVMSVKPGLNLFLYDYDQKVLHGVYKATSVGGMRLEHQAFGGSFPAQVRFKVANDCQPLPISEFKNAFREIFNMKKNMFKVELSLSQAQTLAGLFTKPSLKPKEHAHQAFQFSSVPLLAPASSSVPVQVQLPMRHGVSEGGHPISREPARETKILNESDYRTYGLQVQHSASVLPSTIPVPPTSGPPVDLQHRRPEIYLSRSYDMPRISNPHSAQYSLAHQVEADRPNTLLYPDYLVGHDSVKSYYARREPEFSERSRAYESENVRSAYTASSSLDYNKRLEQPSRNYSLQSLPVSSRYAFAGPALTYR